MSDMIDMSNSRANIAYAGQVPWHGKGNKLLANASIEEWTAEAGLAYTVERTPVLFDCKSDTPGDFELARFEGRDVLYRNDTRGKLSIVSSDYKIVQPRTVMQFFAELTRHNKFTMEVAGALDGGKRIWALARVHDGAPVVGYDIVRPYVLLATSYDGTMSTIAKFTSICVVCHNTLTAAAGYAGMNASEQDTQATCIRVPHSADFLPSEARRDLGIALDQFDRFMIDMKRLASEPVDDKFAVEFLKTLLIKSDESDEDVEAGRTFKRLMATWKGEVPSLRSEESKGTAWGLLNAVTWDVDHVRGHDSTRLGSAWFGTGEALKNKARELLVATIS